MIHKNGPELVPGPFALPAPGDDTPVEDTFEGGGTLQTAEDVKKRIEWQVHCFEDGKWTLASLRKNAFPALADYFDIRTNQRDTRPYSDALEGLLASEQATAARKRGYDRIFIQEDPDRDSPRILGEQQKHIRDTIREHIGPGFVSSRALHNHFPSKSVNPNAYQHNSSLLQDMVSAEMPDQTRALLYLTMLQFSLKQRLKEKILQTLHVSKRGNIPAGDPRSYWEKILIGDAVAQEPGVLEREGYRDGIVDEIFTHLHKQYATKPEAHAIWVIMNALVTMWTSRLKGNEQLNAVRVPVLRALGSGSENSSDAEYAIQQAILAHPHLFTTVAHNDFNITQQDIDHYRNQQRRMKKAVASFREMTHERDTVSQPREAATEDEQRAFERLKIRAEHDRKIRATIEKLAQSIGHTIARGSILFDDSGKKYMKGTLLFIRALDDKKAPSIMSYQDIGESGTASQETYPAPFLVVREWMLDRSGARTLKQKQSISAAHLAEDLVLGDAYDLGDLGDLSMKTRIDDIQDKIRDHFAREKS